jgi:hypothetical protein
MQDFDGGKINISLHCHDKIPRPATWAFGIGGMISSLLLAKQSNPQHLYGDNRPWWDEIIVLLSRKNWIKSDLIIYGMWHNLTL